MTNPACEISDETCYGDTHQPVGHDIWFCESHGNPMNPISEEDRGCANYLVMKHEVGEVVKNTSKEGAFRRLIESMKQFEIDYHRRVIEMGKFLADDDYALKTP